MVDIAAGGAGAKPDLRAESVFALSGSSMRFCGVLVDSRIGLFDQPLIQSFAQLPLNGGETLVARQVIHFVGIVF